LISTVGKELQIRDAPDIVFAGYPAGRISGSSKAGYRISGRISGKGRIPDIRPDTWLDNYGIFLVKYHKFFLKSFNNYSLLQTLNKA
jgi:hypothetical protein